MLLPWQQGSAPQHFAWFHWIGNPRKSPDRCKHLRSICHTSGVIGDFVWILGSKFWALVGLKQKSKKTVLQSATWRNDGQKMARFHRETEKKNQFEGAWQTNRHPDRQTESTADMEIKNVTNQYGLIWREVQLCYCDDVTKIVDIVTFGLVPIC